METESIYNCSNKKEVTKVNLFNKFVIRPIFGIQKVQNYMNSHIRKNLRENLTVLVEYPLQTREGKYSHMKDIAWLIIVANSFETLGNHKVKSSDPKKLWCIIKVEWNKFHNNWKETITPHKLNNTMQCGINGSNKQNSVKIFLNSLEGNLKLLKIMLSISKKNKEKGKIKTC